MYEFYTKTIIIQFYVKCITNNSGNNYGYRRIC